MKFSIREVQSFIYLIILLVCLVFLVISFNNLVIKDQGLINLGLTLGQAGDWLYWILTVAFIGAAIFLYLFLKSTIDVRKFRQIVGGNSKQNFLKNLKELEVLARKLGPSFEESLASAKAKWNVK